MQHFINHFLPLKLEDTVQIKGDETGFVYTIDLIVNSEALLKYRNKLGIFKISHWQHCSELTAIKNIDRKGHPLFSKPLKR